MKTQVAFGQAPVAPDMELVLDESLSWIPTMDVEEIQRFSTFLPVIVLIPKSVVKDHIGRLTTVEKFSTESSHTNEILEVFGQTMEQFKGTSAEGIYAFGDVTVRFSAMEVLRKGTRVVLTTMEFRTLKYLIQNAPRVISRKELLHEVWGYKNYYPCTRTVDNHILTLRRKLEPDPSHPVHLRTVHRVGYKFSP